MNCDLDTSIPDWIIEHPEATQVFADFGLEIGCGGKSLRYVCHSQGMSPPAVLQRLNEAVSQQAVSQQAVSQQAGQPAGGTACERKDPTKHN